MKSRIGVGTGAAAALGMAAAFMPVTALAAENTGLQAREILGGAEWNNIGAFIMIALAAGVGGMIAGERGR